MPPRKAPTPLLPPSEILSRLYTTADPFFLTTEETAQLLRLTVRTIRTYLGEGGKFPGARKITDGYLIPAADLRTLLGITAPTPHGQRRTISPGVQ